MMAMTTKPSLASGGARASTRRPRLVTCQLPPRAERLSRRPPKWRGRVPRAWLPLVQSSAYKGTAFAHSLRKAPVPGVRMVCSHFRRTSLSALFTGYSRAAHTFCAPGAKVLVVTMRPDLASS